MRLLKLISLPLTAASSQLVETGVESLGVEGRGSDCDI